MRGGMRKDKKSSVEFSLAPNFDLDLIV